MNPSTESLLPPATPAVRTLRRVVAAIVLLAIAIVLIGMPLRQRHVERVNTIRAQINGAIATADGMRMAVALYRARNGGAWPYNSSQAGLLSLSAVNGKYVDNAQIENGRIVITLGGQIDRKLRGEHIALTPYLDGALVLWHCGSSDVAKDWLPETCR